MTSAPPETIELGDAVLCRVRATDGPAFAAAVTANIEHLRPWIRWGNAEGASLAVQQERCEGAEREWDEGTAYIYSLRERPDGSVIGALGLHRRIGADAIELGYWLDAGHTGRGLVTAAARSLTAAALALPGVTRVEIHTDEANLASSAVARRLGYHLERVQDAEPWGEADTGRLEIWVTP